MMFDANGVALDPRGSLAHIDENVTLIVQVPQRAAAPEANLLQIILPHILANALTTLTERDSTFKERLCEYYGYEYYGCFRRKKTWMRCMLLDVAFPRSLVIASHLFRRSNEYLSLAMMQISDIDDEKNGLLLFKPLKYALDHFQISFIRDDSGVFRLKLFDPSIKDTRIIDLKDRKGNDVLTTEQTGVLFNSVSRAKERYTFDVATTFGNLDGEPLVFTGLERPYYRCLNLQARVARMIALKKNRIDASYDFEDFWTEVSLDDKMEMFHRSIMNADQAMF
ncbi:Crinkler (CRN) family protein [Phytophthora palmivora]|uniref:Crinkler (CRN) family protein n=1 Tax=Phytophthora palmivora TaxID=4796 RepID=A0A2P4XNE2_9STRA|nr:Crinkler (CRN) family protein [Phytophthora palmivora]